MSHQELVLHEMKENGTEHRLLACPEKQEYIVANYLLSYKPHAKGNESVGKHVWLKYTTALPCGYQGECGKKK